MRYAIWFLAALCTLLAFAFSATTYAPRAEVTGMWIVIGLATAGIILAMVSAVRQRRSGFALAASILVVLINIRLVVGAAMALGHNS